MRNPFKKRVNRPQSLPASEVTKHLSIIDAGDRVEWDWYHNEETGERYVTDIRHLKGYGVTHSERVWFVPVQGTRGVYYLTRVNDLEAAMTREEAFDLFEQMKDVLGNDRWR